MKRLSTKKPNVRGEEGRYFRLFHRIKLDVRWASRFILPKKAQDYSGRNRYAIRVVPYRAGISMCEIEKAEEQKLLDEEAAILELH